MTVIAKYRGFDIEWDDRQWIFSDSGLPTIGSESWQRCGECNLYDTPEGHDGCLGTLPESVVMNACCGHGVDSQAYIQYWGGSCVRGEDAIKIIEELKNYE